MFFHVHNLIYNTRIWAAKRTLGYYVIQSFSILFPTAIWGVIILCCDRLSCAPWDAFFNIAALDTLHAHPPACMITKNVSGVCMCVRMNTCEIAPCWDNWWSLSWSYKQTIYHTWEGLIKQEKLLYTPHSPNGTASWSGTFCEGCRDWEMHRIFRRPKVVSLWYQTTHLFELKTY